MRAAVLASLYGCFLLLDGSDLGEAALASGGALVTVVVIGWLMHWRDLLTMIRARRQL